MIIEEIEIDMQHGQLAEPKITMLVDELSVPFHYEKHQINAVETILIGSHHTHPFRQLYGHNANNENGFGGQEFKLEDKNGNAINVKGLWNCSVYAINGALGTDLLPVYLQGPHSRMLFYIPAASLNELFGEHNLQYEIIVAAPDNGDIIFSVRPFGKKPKNPEFEWTPL